MLKRKRAVNSEDEVALDEVMNSKRIKKLDKIYIIAACALAFVWLAWSLVGVKLSSFNFNFISDAYSNWKAASGQTSLKANYNYGTAMDKDYIYYYNQEVTGLYRMKTDGTQNSRVLKDDIRDFIMSDGEIYYTDSNGKLKKAEPGGTPVILEDKTRVVNFAKDGNDIYYISQNKESFGLNSVDINGGNNKKVIDGEPFMIIPYGNYIYFIDINGKSIDRIEKSGGKKQVLVKSNDQGYNELGIYKGWIYYILNRDLYKCRLDGSKATELQKNVMNYSIENDTMYVNTELVTTQNAEGFYNTSTELYSMDLVGKEKKLLDKANSYLTYFTNGMVEGYDSSGERYFKDIKTGNTVRIPEVKLTFAAGDLRDRIGEMDNTRKIPGIDVNGAQIIKNNNYVYYIEQNQGGIFKMNEEDGKVSPIADGIVNNIDGVGKLLFFTEMDPGTNFTYLYCVNDDGTGLEKVFDFPVRDFYIEKDGIYFTSNLGHLYKAQFADNRILKVTDDPVQSFKIYNGYIYIYHSVNTANELYRIKEDGTSKEKILDGLMNKFIISNGYVFYNNMFNDNGAGIYKYKIGDKAPVRLVKSVPVFGADSKYLYFQDEASSGIYRSDFEGNNKVKIYDIPYPMFVDGDTLYVDRAEGLKQITIEDMHTNGNK